MTKGYVDALNAPSSLREAYNRCRARLGLATNPDMPIEFVADRQLWITSDGQPHYASSAAARAQAEFDLKIESMTLPDRVREGLGRLRKRMEKTTLSQAPGTAAVGRVRVKFGDDWITRWRTTNGDCFFRRRGVAQHEEARWALGASPAA